MQQLAQAWLVLIVDISIKSMLLAGVAGLAILMLRLRDTNLRHRVWTAVLLGMLAMPALVYVTPVVPLPGWLVLAIPAASTEPKAIGDEPDDKLVANLPPNSSGAAGDMSHVAGSNSEAFANQAMNERPPDALGAIQPLAGLDSSKARPIVDNIQTAQPTVAAQITSRLPLVLVSLYVGVAIVFGVRLLVGLALTHRLIVRAREISLVALLPRPRRRRFRLLESTLVYVPATVGFLRPVVLLPMSWRQWSESKLQAVLAHELAHVRRADWLVITLTEVNRAFYWFHPIAWILRRWLSELAEQNCDDAVIETAGDRTQYARYLLEVASSLTSAGSRYRPPLHGLAMARRPNVETRIDAILDAGRPLARRLGTLGVVGLLVIGIPAILLAAALRTAAADAAAAVKVDPIQQAAAGDASDRLEFAGRVVDPNGKPMAGAKIHLLYYTPNAVETRPLGQTDASGAFDFAVTKKDFDTREMNETLERAYVVAIAPEYGLEAASATSFEKSGALLAAMRAKPNFLEQYANLVADRTLRLVADDVPIEGRILNLEGQPVTGATVQVVEIHWNRENSLEPWLKAVENEKADFYQAREHVTHGFHGHHRSGQVPQLFPKVVTGADGRFRIDGIGRERIMLMQIQGPGIETREVYSRTRPGAALRVIDERRDPEGSSSRFYPAKFDFPTAPSRPVIGVVRDVDSGKPLAGVTIQAQRIAGQRTSGWSNHYIHAKTDAEGRYRLEGLPIGESELMAAPPSEEPYLIASLTVETKPAQDTTTLDFKLKRGVWIRGRVTDATSGKPLRARVEYFAFDENPNIKAAPGLMRAWDPFCTTDADGRFGVPGLPGHGLIAVMADNHRDYPRGAGAEDIKGGRGDDQGMMFNTSPYRALVPNFHYFVEVNPAADTDGVECAIALVAGKRLDGTVLDPEGKPLSGTMFAGENQMNFAPLAGATFSVRNLEPDRPRRIQFFHKGRKLAGSMSITGDETGPLSVKLEPWVVITGRVLDEDGSPAEKVTIGSGNYQRQKEGLTGVLPEPKPLQTDESGRFRIEGLAPGVEYSLSATKGSRYLGIVSETLQVSAGETKDLGDLTIKPLADQSNNKPATKNNVSKTALKVDIGDRINFAGKVVDAGGKPVRAAKIFMIRFDYIALGATALKPLAETQADGTFEFTAAGKDFHPRDAYIHWGFTPLVATADRHAMVWGAAASFESSGALLKELRADPNFSEQDSTLAGDRTLRLPDDDLPIEGRIVNLEGLPVAAARVKVIEIRCFPRMTLDAWIKLAQSKISPKSPELWRGFDQLGLSEQVRQLFPAVATSADGRFRIDGIGRERIVRLQIEAPAIETRRVYVRTQRGGAIKVGEGSSEPKTIYGASFEFPVGPSRPVTGVVRDVDTQMPLAGVTIQIQTMAGDPEQVWPKESLRTVTDAEGRYRVTGLPIGENSLMALAPFDQPYMLAVQECDTGQVKESLQLDFNLKRGVWVRGRVTDASTGQGVRASVEYYAMLDNPHQQTAPSFWGAKWRPHLTDADGRFAIPAFAGRGLITVHAHDYRAYPIGVGADKIAGAKYEAGVTSIEFRTNPTMLMANNHNAIREVNPAEGVDAPDIDFVLKSGKSLAGTVLDPDGKPLAGAKFSGEVEQTWIWRPLKESSFAVRNVQPGKARRLLFVHEQRQLAGSILLTAEESGPLSVKLEPWGVISGRALDKIGDPLRAVHLVPLFKVGNEWQSGGLSAESWPIDEEGRFTITGLVAGVEYRFRAQTDNRDHGVAVDGVRVSAGETKDLGDVTLDTSE